MGPVNINYLSAEYYHDGDLHFLSPSMNYIDGSKLDNGVGSLIYYEKLDLSISV